MASNQPTLRRSLQMGELFSEQKKQNPHTYSSCMHLRVAFFFCLNSHLSETSLPAKSIDCAACNWEWCIFSVQHFCTVRSGSYSLIPNATCRRSPKTHKQAGRQGGREAPAHTHTHTLFPTELDSRKKGI